MYETFYGFEEPPFSLTPNSQNIFPSLHHQAALQTLLYGIERRVGFMLLSGEVGSGKTTVIRSLLAQLDGKAETSYVINPLLSTLDLLRTINRDLGNRGSTTDSVQKQIEILNKYLLKINEDGRTVVVVIDEAQNLSFEAFEMTRMLSNLETDIQKLINIIFVGQPELEDVLKQRNLRQLAQRIQVHARLRPLTYDQTLQYIDYRIKHSGKNVGVKFEPRAVKRIYKRSKGIPRIINAICDMSLLAAFSQSKFVIDRKIIRQAMKEVPDYVYHS